MARTKFRLEDRDLRLAIDGISPDNIAKELAKFARAELANAITADEASPIYDKFINGRKGAEEETVVPPGPIVYVFSYWEPIIKFALAWLEKNSPVRTGRYQSSHRVMLGSQFVSPQTQIGADEAITIVDTQPYSRKIEVGHMVMSVPDGLYRRCQAAVSTQFGRAVEVRFKMIYLPNGYILKGRFTKGVKKYARRKLQKDTQPGARMTYPSIEMRMR